jgi:hypothetical protein
MMGTEWLEFWAKVGVEAVRFGRVLFEHFHGDAEKATVELRTIHIDARLTKVEAEEKVAAQAQRKLALQGGGEGEMLSDRPMQAEDLRDAKESTRRG